MSGSSPVYSRIDPTLKARAEGILAQLGITPSSAIQMFYSQIVIHQGLPFEPRLPHAMPIAIGDMSRTVLDEELRKGMRDLRAGSMLT